MAKYVYTGSVERVYPSLGIDVKPGDVVVLPDGFVDAWLKQVPADDNTASAGDPPADPKPAA